MSGFSKRKGLYILAIAFLLFGCITIDVKVEVNVNLPKTTTPSATSITTTPDMILQTPTFEDLWITTASPSPTPIPIQRLLPGSPVQFSELIMNANPEGWAIASYGHLIHTKDGGRTWKDVTPQDANIGSWNTYFTDAIRGWIVYGSLNAIKSWKTDFRGDFWEAGGVIDLSNVDTGSCGVLALDNPYIKDLQFIDVTQGWMTVSASIKTIKSGPLISHLTGSLLYATTDAGAHWTLKYFGNPQCATNNGPGSIQSVFFYGPMVGWGGFVEDKYDWPPYNQERYVGGWKVYRTDDGGITWVSQDLPKPPGFLEEAMKSENIKESAVCGVKEIKTLDPLTFMFNAFGARLTCFIAPSFRFEYYYLTSDYGVNWNVWESPGNEEFVIDQVNNNKITGWRLVPSKSSGLSEIQKTVDGGLTWTTIKKVPWMILTTFDFVDEQIGWAVVHIEGGTSSIFMQTTNGGRTWSPLAPVIGE